MTYHPSNGTAFEREHRPAPPDYEHKQTKRQQKITIETKQQIFKIFFRR